MSGNLLKDFSLRKYKNNTSVFLGESSIDSIKCNGHIYELQLNRVRLEFNSDKHMDDGNHLYFHTPSEPPLFKGDSRDVKNKK